VAKQQGQTKIAFALRVLPDHHHVGTRSPDRGSEVAVIDDTDDSHVRLSSDEVVEDVEHQCGHSRQEDTNPLQWVAFRTVRLWHASCRRD